MQTFKITIYSYTQYQHLRSTFLILKCILFLENLCILVWATNFLDTTWKRSQDSNWLYRTIWYILICLESSKKRIFNMVLMHNSNFTLWKMYINVLRHKSLLILLYLWHNIESFLTSGIQINQITFCFVRWYTVIRVIISRQPIF